MDGRVRDLRQALQQPGRIRSGGARVIKEVVDHYAVAPNRKTYTFDLRKTFRFQTGAQVTAKSFADAFNRDANPVLQSPAMTEMHEIVGADAVAAGRTKTISGVRVLSRYRLQIQLTRPLADLFARLTAPFFCPILPGTPISPPAATARLGPARTTWPADSPTAKSFSNETSTTAAVVRRTSTGSYGRSERAATPVSQTLRRIGSTIALRSRVPPDAFRDLAATYGINKKDGQFFVSPRPTTLYFAFNHDRPAFKGAGQIPLEKAINYAIDRRALAGAYGFEAGKRTDQMLPRRSAGTRASTRSPLIRRRPEGGSRKPSTNPLDSSSTRATLRLGPKPHRISNSR